MSDWMSVAMSSWLPFLVLIAVWLWASRRAGMQARGSSGATMIELYEQQLAEGRRMNLILERVATALEERESSQRSQADLK
jgi:ATP-dependent Zn protease